MDREEFIRNAEKLIEKTVFKPLGAWVERWDPDALAVAVDIDDRHRQPMGWLHGGVSALLAESAATMAAAMRIDLVRAEPVGVDLNITHLRSKREGRVLATARPLHVGRTFHVFAVEVTDDLGHLLSACRCTIAVRVRRDEGGTADGR